MGEKLLLGAAFVTCMVPAPGTGKGASAMRSEADFMRRYEALERAGHEISRNVEATCENETCLLDVIVEREATGNIVCTREVLVPKNDAILIALFHDMVANGEPQTEYSMSIYALERQHLERTGACERFERRQ